jgi:hypothetical protein
LPTIFKNTPPPKRKRQARRIPHTGNAKPDHLAAPVVREQKAKEKDHVDAPQHQEMNQAHHVCTCAEGEEDRRAFDKVVVAFYVSIFHRQSNDVGEAF